MSGFIAARARVDDLRFSHRQYSDGLRRLRNIWNASQPEPSVDSESEELGDDLPFDFGDDAVGLELEESPEQDARSNCVLIIGGSGAGKTNLIAGLRSAPELQSTYGQGLQDHLPFVEMILPDSATPKACITALFAVLKQPPPKSWTRNTIARRLRRLFADLGIRMVLIDEAHAMVEDRKPETVRRMARFWKFMLVSCRVTFVFAGEEPLERLLSYTALRRRMFAPVRLRPYVWGRKAENTEFQNVVRAVDEALRLPHRSDLWKTKNAARLYYDSEGVIGLMAKRMLEAFQLAEEAGDDRLELHHLGKAWDQWNTRFLEVSANPFQVVDPAPTANPQNPYDADDAAFVALWHGRYVKAPVEKVEKSRRGCTRTSKKDKIEAFGKMGR